MLTTSPLPSCLPGVLWGGTAEGGPTAVTVALGRAGSFRAAFKLVPCTIRHKFNVVNKTKIGRIFFPTKKITENKVVSVISQSQAISHFQT